MALSPLCHPSEQGHDVTVPCWGSQSQEVLWESSVDAESVSAQSGVAREHSGTGDIQEESLHLSVPTALAHAPTSRQRVPRGDATTVAHVSLQAARGDQDTPVPLRATLG